jgi:hypothetical protein
MAGLKITDLTTLAEATSDDLLYIVDVTDTTMSPEGTSKKIAVGSLLPSGSYNVTFSNNTGAIIGISFADALYTRQGNVFNVTIQGTMSVNFSGTNTGNADFTLPFGAAISAHGNVVLETGKVCNGIIRDTNTMILKSDDTSLVDDVKFIATFQYQIA